MRDEKTVRECAKRFEEKLKKIKVCAFDVDGILTDGRVWWQDETIGWNRYTNIHDGYGLKVLQRAGYKVGVITGGDSFSITKRFGDNLKLDFIFKGNEDKRDAFRSLMSEGYDRSEILYMGDEHFDMPLLRAAGFSATVPEAGFEVKAVCDYVTTASGGAGAAREVIDMLRVACGILPESEGQEV
ncbi:MAG: HAD hydrolase family protein [Bdellovibrionota bacterium]|nr:HAD hydrolase family protein [Bdellovibrionota bacterium]